MEDKFLTLGLGAEVASAAGQLGFKEPLPIQTAAIPKILAGKNIVGQSPTGTGKTLAYLLPLLDSLAPDSQYVQALIIAPTYELCMQITNEARRILSLTSLGLKVQPLIGGANINRQIDGLKKKPQLVIGSIGRMQELLARKKLILTKVKCVVLDEFDRLLDEQNFAALAGFLPQLPTNGVQYLMFSATASRQALEKASFIGEPELVRVKDDTNETARENFFVVAPFRDKIDTVRRLTRSLPIRRGLVFINRIYDAAKTLERLRYEGIKAETLLGTAGKQTRQSAIAAFKAGRVPLLLSTDLAARGLDIADIDYVINLDFPESPKMYKHRAGRTARAGTHGTVITLVDPKEKEKLKLLSEKLGVKIRPLPRPKTATKNSYRKNSGTNCNRKYPSTGQGGS